MVQKPANKTKSMETILNPRGGVAGSAFLPSAELPTDDERRFVHYTIAPLLELLRPASQPSQRNRSTTRTPVPMKTTLLVLQRLLKKRESLSLTPRLTDCVKNIQLLLFWTDHLAAFDCAILKKFNRRYEILFVFQPQPTVPCF